MESPDGILSLCCFPAQLKLSRLVKVAGLLVQCIVSVVPGLSLRQLSCMVNSLLHLGKLYLLYFSISISK